MFPNGLASKFVNTVKKQRISPNCCEILELCPQSANLGPGTVNNSELAVNSLEHRRPEAGYSRRTRVL
jgi:hypothetical protein